MSDLLEHSSFKAAAISRFAVVLIAAALSAGPAAAARQPAHHVRHYSPTDPSAIGESIVIDTASGRVLSQANADLTTYPASLTKMMTLYLTFEALNAGRLHLDQYLPVSAEAAAQAPTKLGLVAGDSVMVRDLILGIVTRSANDAAVVLAEGLGGSVPAFADRMNRKAALLGMARTHYTNPSGLPDPDQQTTARDTARLALALIRDFPREYGYFSTREFEFRGALIHGHDHLLDWYEGADGIKTGYIRTSGFNLATSAVRNGHRLIGVVMGGHTARGRDDEMAQLLDAGFAEVGVAPAVAYAASQPQHPPVPVVAPAAPVIAQAAPVVTRAAPAAVQAMPAVASAAPTAAQAPRPDTLAGAAARLAAHLKPVANAEAAPLAHDARAAAKDRWSVQLGAFRAPAAAEKVAREAASLSLAKDRPLQIVHPGKGKDRLYRARLLDFTPAQAQEVCAQLKARHIDCAVVRPGTKLAAVR